MKGKDTQRDPLGGGDRIDFPVGEAMPWKTKSAPGAPTSS